MTDDKTIQGPYTVEEWGERIGSFQWVGPTGRGPLVAYISAKRQCDLLNAAFRAGQASQQRGEQPSQSPSVSVEAVVEVVKRWTFHISGCENESEWNDPAWQKEVADLRSRLSSLLNGQQKG